jgi:DME family drug/metabolite transporter
MLNSRRSSICGYTFILTAALCWATIGIFYRAIIEQYGLSQSVIVAYRSGLAALLLGLGTLVLRRSSLRIRRHDIPFFLMFGIVGVAGFFRLYMEAVTRGSVAQAAILLYTAPVWIMLWSVLRDGERITRQQFRVLVLAITGCALVAQVYDPARLALNLPAIVIGLLTGMAYAAYIVWSAVGTRRGYDSWTVVLYALSIGAVALFIVTPPAETLHVLTTPRVWPLLFGVAIITSLLGQVSFTLGLRDVRPSTASLLATIEPVAAAGLAWILWGEALVWQQILGGVCVLLAVLTLLRRPHPSPPSQRPEGTRHPESLPERASR